MAVSNPIISIVTPSYNMLSYLKMCAASVADQDIAHEHLVMDGGSTDGTVEWLAVNTAINSVSEKDGGMYNALNKAIDASRGEIIGHLNCDEQYLPGVLKTVKDFFDAHPDVDFLAGDFLVIDPDGELIAFRKTFQPRWQFFFSNYLYTTTCALFYRRAVFQNIRFDESYRSIADVIFVATIMRKGFKGAHIRKYFAVFTYTGDNLSLNPISAAEKIRFNRTLPSWYRIMKPVFFVLFFIEKLMKGTYSEKHTLSYSIFAKSSLLKRILFTKTNPGFRLVFKKAK